MSSSDERWSRAPRSAEEYERWMREDRIEKKNKEREERERKEREKKFIESRGGVPGMKIRLQWLAHYCRENKTTLIKDKDEYEDLVYYILMHISYVVEEDDGRDEGVILAKNLVGHSIFYSPSSWDKIKQEVIEDYSPGNGANYSGLIDFYTLICKLLYRANRTYEEFDEIKNLTTYSWTDDFDPIVVKVYNSMPDKFTKKEWDEVVVKNLVSVRTGARWIDALKKAQRLRRIGNHKDGYYIKVNGIDDKK